jgi:hypothetical protein
LITKLGDKVDKNNHPIYALTDSKILACEDVAEHLDINFGSLLTHHFPSNIRKPVKCSNHCKDCQSRIKLISTFRRVYNRKNFSVENLENPYVPDDRIKNITLVDQISHLRFRLNVQQQEEFREKQEALKCLDEHFRDKKMSTKFWRDLIVENKIRPDTVIMVFDGMCDLGLGDGHNVRGLSGPKSYVSPIGFVFIYACPVTGKSKRISRLCIPNSVVHNSWQYITCLKKLFQKNDPELLSLFRTRNKLITTQDCAQNVGSKELLRTILIDINKIIPGLVIRVSDWIPRIQLHGVNDADKFFGSLKILFYNELKRRDFWFQNKQELVKFFRNSFRTLNEKNRDKNNYKIWCIHIEVPPDDIDLFKFHGCQTSKWLRSNIRDNESVSSVINYINPWEESIQRQTFSENTLDNMIQTEDREESQTTIQRLRPGRALKNVRKKSDLGRRSNTKFR